MRRRKRRVDEGGERRYLSFITSMVLSLYSSIQSETAQRSVLSAAHTPHSYYS